jgi:hypothetical protein
VLKKEKIRNNTENIGFFVKTTKIDDVKQNPEKNSEKITFQKHPITLVICRFF